MAKIGGYHFQAGTVNAVLFDVVSEGTGRTVGRVAIMSNGLWTIEALEPAEKHYAGNLNQLKIPREPSWSMDADTAEHLWNNWKVPRLQATS